MGIPRLCLDSNTVIDMGFSLKVSVVVCVLAIVGLEAKPAPALPVGSAYSFSSQLGSNTIDQQQPAETTRTTARGRVVAGGPTDITSYLPSVDTPEVQAAKEKFFDAFKQQTDLINEVREDGLWSAQPYSDYYDLFEEAGAGETEYEGEEEEEEGEGGEEEEDDDDDDEEDDDDEDDSDSSSSSEEDSSSSSEEDSDEDDEDEGDDDEEDEDEEDEDEEDDDEEDDDEEDSDEDSSSSSSSSEEDGDDSSSSSSSSSSEENGDPALLSMRALQSLQPKQVEDTPEVEAAKQRFFDSYKAQLELVSNDV